MNDIMGNLLKLQALEFDSTSSRKTETQSAEIRSLIPAQVLGHYDRLRARGKKGIAVVRNQVCTGCHMRIPIGTVNTLMQGKDIQLCDTCGRYLYLATEAEVKPAEPVAKAKPGRKAKVQLTNVA